VDELQVIGVGLWALLGTVVVLFIDLSLHRRLKRKLAAEEVIWQDALLCLVMFFLLFGASVITRRLGLVALAFIPGIGLAVLSEKLIPLFYLAVCPTFLKGLATPMATFLAKVFSRMVVAGAIIAQLLILWVPLLEPLGYPLVLPENVIWKV